MARALPSLLVLALLGATAAAFALTEGQKLRLSPITRTQVGRTIPGQPHRLGPALFSPICRCRSDHVSIRFFLRRAGRVTVTIRDSGGGTVATLVDDRSYRRGWVRLAWNGLEPSGIVAGDGVYKPYVHLAREHRTIGLPNPITVDSTAPTVASVVASRLVLSPDGDGRGDVLTVRYKLAEPAHGLLFVDGVRRVRTRFARKADALRWYGKLPDGKPLATGPHVLAFAAQDAAGNVSKRKRLGTLTIRYVTLARSLVSVGPRERFYIRVSTDAKRVGWRFAGRSGSARPGTLVLRAPKRVGSYRLYVSVGGRADSARVKVERIG
ncbi:MAG TPA: hypothetical protein VFL66_10520 [Gaiellaceae bacterium]|nr:hypothetical protein [Gaiellaceae bacterium]